MSVTDNIRASRGCVCCGDGLLKTEFSVCAECSPVLDEPEEEDSL